MAHRTPPWLAVRPPGPARAGRRRRARRHRAPPRRGPWGPLPEPWRTTASKTTVSTIISTAAAARAANESRPRRVYGRRRRPGGFQQAVSDPAAGAERTVAAGGTELAAQPVLLLTRAPSGSPPGHQGTAGDQAARGSDEYRRQPELGRCQVHGRIEQQVARRGGRRRAARSPGWKGLARQSSPPAENRVSRSSRAWCAVRKTTGAVKPRALRARQMSQPSTSGRRTAGRGRPRRRGCAASCRPSPVARYSSAGCGSPVGRSSVRRRYTQARRESQAVAKSQPPITSVNQWTPR